MKNTKTMIESDLILILSMRLYHEGLNSKKSKQCAKSIVDVLELNIRETNSEVKEVLKNILEAINKTICDIN